MNHADLAVLVHCDGCKQDAKGLYFFGSQGVLTHAPTLAPLPGSVGAITPDRCGLASATRAG